jgi:hypothetical protein
MGAEARIKELGITLPPPPKPAGTYVPGVRVGNLLYLSGHGRSTSRARRVPRARSARISPSRRRRRSRVKSASIFSGQPGLCSGAWTR